MFVLRDSPNIPRAFTVFDFAKTVKAAALVRIRLVRKRKTVR